MIWSRYTERRIVMEEISHMIHKMPRRCPADGTFELTVRCNLHCKMCLFRHDDSENQRIMEEELTAEQWIDMSEQAAEAGTVSLLITGGEPMIRSDFSEIWKGIYQKGFLMTLYTNATLVTDEIMQTLEKYPPHKIGVTIYGASPEIYEKVCGNGDAFQRAIEGMHHLQRLPSKMEFRTTIIKDNYEDFDNICDLVREEFGAQYRLIQTRIVTQSVRGACADVRSCRLDPEDNVRLAFHRGINIIKDYIGDSYDEKNLYAVYQDKSGDSTLKPRVTLFGCDAGMRSYTISWDGQLLGCQMLGNFAEDAVGKGFQKAWDDFPKKVRLPAVNEKCQGCENHNICSSCCASRYAETKDLGGCPEYVCRDTAIVSELLRRKRNGNKNIGEV